MSADALDLMESRCMVDDGQEFMTYFVTVEDMEKIEKSRQSCWSRTGWFAASLTDLASHSLCRSQYLLLCASKPEVPCQILRTRVAEILVKSTKGGFHMGCYIPFEGNGGSSSTCSIGKRCSLRIVDGPNFL